MRLHENWGLFSDALQAASQSKEDGGLGIKSIFIEKDYWICRSLALMAMNDEETRIYLESDAFKADFANLFTQDQQRFDKPEGWQDKDIMDSPIINDLHGVWSTLGNVYSRELPDLAYKEIPTVDSIENSMGQLFSYLAK